MKENVQIWRDENGIPHVEAENERDLYWGMGYVHGTDRAMQMLFMRILGQGRVSENSAWFGGDSREAIYRRVAEEALQVSPRRWGDVRRVVMSHLLLGGKLPAFLGFDRGPITILGNRATIHQGQIYRAGNRTTTFCPSFRMVMDLSTEEVHSNLAGGPSDRRFSRWYCSGLEGWIKGEYKTVRPDGPRRKFP